MHWRRRPQRLEARREAVVLAARRAKDAGELERARELVYAALGALASRAPGCVVGSTALPTLLFSALGSEGGGLRLAVAESLGAVAGVYTGAAPSILDDLASLLLRCADSPEPRVRQAALDWAVRVFPFADVRARYICLRLVSDPRVEVRGLA